MPAGEATPDVGPDVTAGLRDLDPQVAAAAAGVPLLDHHVHTVFRGPVDRAAFEDAINEGSTAPTPSFLTMFDSPLGFAIRRWCAPLLGLTPHADADAYWATRARLGDEEVARALLPAAGVERWLVDTGYSGDAIVDVASFEALSGAPAAQILRLEALAEQLARAGTSAGDYPEAVRHHLAEVPPEVVGTKTIAAYRVGFDIDWTRPSDEAVSRAYRDWQASGSPRLADPVLIAFGVHAAIEARLPLQVHVGLGDRDLDLHRVDPMLLLPLLRAVDGSGVPVLLLHCYPFHRQAGYLAQAFAGVYFDVGEAVNYLGARSTALVAEALELAPFAKQLYSSDAFGLPELHLLGAVLWRRAMADVASAAVARGDWSAPDAVRVIGMIARDNARRVYGL